MLGNMLIDTNENLWDKEILLSESTLETLERLEYIYGLDESKNIVRNYAMYIRLNKLNKVNIGSYNILIRNVSKYDSTKQLIDVIKDLLLEEEIITTTYRYLSREDIIRRQNEEKIIEDLIVIDSEILQRDLLSYKVQIMEFMDKHPEKIYILVDSHSRVEGIINANFFEYITWNVKLKEVSKENKVDYIERLLIKNRIAVDDKSTFVNVLSNEPFWIVKDEITNIILECKMLGIRQITDDVVKNTLCRKYYNRELNENKRYNGNALTELNNMIGMKEVKEQLEQIINYIKVNKARGKLPMLHMCFLGNPGTGKTTVARIIGEIFAEMKILSAESKFVEVQRADLIGEYVGHTAPKTKVKIDEATGGILFIDEAYSLSTYMQGGNSRDFGAECIATLMKEMEDKRDNLCVILAGYTSEMEEMLKVNPGFESRIQFKIHFPDYTKEELYEIFKKMAKEEEYKLSCNLKPIVMNYFEQEKKKENFSNARCVRNLFEKVKFEQANRVAKAGATKVNMVCKEDVEKVIAKLSMDKCEKRKMGFNV